MTSLLLAALAIIPQPKEVREFFGLVPVDTSVVVEHVDGMAAESYSLDIDPAGTITIRSSDKAGEFYARQTLKQVLGCDGYKCMLVNDAPRSRWRGMLLDECRHFFGNEPCGDRPRLPCAFWSPDRLNATRGRLNAP